MRILELTAENIKKLTAVHIHPDGRLVQITGRNGQGKTSVLDSIWWALEGAEHIQAQPIRKGQTTARVRLDLGELVVERKFTEKGSTLTVENTEGARFPTPQRLLDSLIGALSFDPLAFSRMKPAEQRAELLAVVPLKVDIDALDALNRGDYSKRTEVNRDAAAARTRAAGVKVPSWIRDTDIRVSESEAIDNLTKASDQNVRIESAKAARARRFESNTQAAARARGKLEEAEALYQRSLAIRDEAFKLQADCDIEAEALQQLPEIAAPQDITELRALVSKAREQNDAVQLRTDRDRHAQTAADLEASSQDITRRMEERSKAKAAALAEAPMPVAGLSVSDAGVTYNGIPLEQCSSAEQLQVSVGIAMAANPKLRVIRIEDGSLLDTASLVALEKIAEERDFQIWVERVDDSGKVGIVIEDGEVKNAQA